MPLPPTSSPLVCVGKIASAHGIKGQVKLYSYTDIPESIAAYGPIYNEKGTKSFTFTIDAKADKHLIASIKGVTDRNQAEALRGTVLYIPRDALPDTGQDSYYHTDLIGLEARREDGTPYGRVFALHNFGAGDVLEITLAGTKETVMLAFSDAAVPGVFIEDGYITVRPLEEE